MRAFEILREQTEESITVPDGIWKRVPATPELIGQEGNPHAAAWVSRPGVRVWALKSKQAHVHVGIVDKAVRHIEGINDLPVSWIKQNLEPLIRAEANHMSHKTDLKFTQSGQLVWPKKEFPLKVEVKADDKYTWYSCDARVYRDVWQGSWGYGYVLPEMSGMVYVLRSNDHISDVARCVIQIDQGQITHADGSVTNAELAPLLQLTHVKNSVISTQVFGGKAYVQDGEIRNTMPLLKGNLVGELSDKSKVYEVPDKYRWIVHVWLKKSYANADKLLKLEPHGYESQLVIFAIKNNKIVGKGTLTAPPANMKKWPILISQELNLGVEKPEGVQIKPNSVMHKMLRHINENPGGNRTDVFVKGLGKKSTLGLGSIHDRTTTDGFAWAAKLIIPYAPGTERYSYQITTKGKMLLAMLDAGKSISENSLINWTA